MTKGEYQQMVEDIVMLHHSGDRQQARGMVIALERMGKDMEEVYKDIEEEEITYRWDREQD